VIARLGLDHTALLGDTLAAIAGEKAGIIKQGCPVVSYPQEEEAAAVIAQVAREHQSALSMPDFEQLGIGRLASIDMLEDAAGAGAAEVGSEGVEAGSEGGEDAAGADAGATCAGAGAGETGAESAAQGEAFVRHFSYRGVPYVTQLLGSYQPYNASVALEVIEVLRNEGWNIPQCAVYNGIAQTTWPGRFEIIGHRPLRVVDGGHNPQCARAMAETLSELLPGKKVVFMIGILADKDYPDMLDCVVPFGSHFVTVTPNNPRALPAAELAAAIKAKNPGAFTQAAESFGEAARLACELAGEHGVVCAFGSLYSVAEACTALQAQ